MSKRFEHDLEEKQHREALTTFAFREEELGEKLRSLREGEFGVNRLHGLLKELRHPGGDCPSDLVTLVGKMVRTRNATLSIERIETESEAALRDLSSSTESFGDAEPNERRAVRYVEEKIADIRGLDSLYPENDLRELLVLEVEQPMKKFKEEDVDAMTFERLRFWAKWVSDVDRKLDKVESVLQSARLLLTRENLEPFDKVLTGKDSKRLFKQYMRKVT